MKPLPRGRVIASLCMIAAFSKCAAVPAPAEDLHVPQMIVESTPPQDPNRVLLGRLLFHDPRLSKNRDISCSGCHVLKNFGVDGHVSPSDSGGRSGRRDTPTVYNVGSHIAQYWDGRALDVETQAAQAVLNPVELAMTDEKAVVDVLGAVPKYVEMFRGAFPFDDHPISLRNVGVAIGAFERGLVTRSRWDKFIGGDRSALTPHERRGFAIFMQRGCIVCHAGPQVGGTSFQKVGAVFPWPNQADWGRATVTHLETDRMVFKVPSLKNIAETEPYFHDGSVSSLDTAIRLMAHHQLGIEIIDEEVDAIADWMRSMTGEPDLVYVARPQLP